MLKNAVVLFVLLFYTVLQSQNTKDSLLLKLDETIKKEQLFQDIKQKEISLLKSRFNKSSTANKYKYYLELGKAYEVFVADSANYYSTLALKEALELNDEYKINESKILLASTEAKEGMFPVAIQILEEFNRNATDNRLLIEYYKALSEVYIYWIEYQAGHEVGELVAKRNAVRDSLISILPKNSAEYSINLGTKLIELKRFKEAENLLLKSFEKSKNNNRDYSILTSILAYLYESTGDKNKQKEFLTLSAISDIQSSIKENLSLRSLALELYEDGDITRANFYIKKSLKDANFFNARLRNIQISRILPIIDTAYEIEKQNQEKKLRTLLVLITILAAIAVFALVFIFLQMKKISKARYELSKINDKLVILNKNLNEANEIQNNLNSFLSEANHIKEQYIHSFLEMCTEYIHRLENFKRIVGGKIKSGQSSEILKMIDSPQAANQELKELYKNFDKAFLNVYPTFVSEINFLLHPEQRYLVKTDKNLNQELRIYAMIRLGVSENSQIATFLHYSLRTVYNYRSKVKSKAVYPDKFEEDVMQIGLKKF